MPGLEVLARTRLTLRSLPLEQFAYFPHLYGIGRYRRITFDRGAGKVSVRTRTWFWVSETNYAYSNASLELHERRVLIGFVPSRGYVPMFRLGKDGYLIRPAMGRTAQESFAVVTAEKLGIPFSWSEERVVSLL
jgi:hypothetical protein